MTPLEEVRALVHARGVLDEQVRLSAVRALEAGEKRWLVASELGMSRSSFYRKLAVERVGGDGWSIKCEGKLGSVVNGKTGGKRN